MALNIGEDFVHWWPSTGGDKTLGLPDFAIFPHVDHPAMPDNSVDNAEKWAAGVGVKLKKVSVPQIGQRAGATSKFRPLLLKPRAAEGGRKEEKVIPGTGGVRKVR